jgi:signal transduction histidine kinase
MRLRSIRSRVLVLIMLPLLSLVGLYAFATSITAGDAITLARALSIRNTVDDPAGLYTEQLQTERLLATIYIAAPTAQNLAALAAQEAKTGRFLSETRAAARSASTAKDASPQVKAALAAELADSAALPALRQRVGSRTITISQAQNEYSTIIAASFNTIIQTVLEMPNAHLETQALAVMRITRSMEILLQEQSLLAGDVMTHSFSAAARTRFAVLVGEHRGLAAEAMADLDPVYLSYYRHDVNPAANAALTGLENTVISTPAAAVSRIPVLSFEQYSAVVAEGLGDAGFRAGLTLATYGNQVAGPVNWRLVLAAGVGLFAILVSVIASIWIGRGLVRELGGLRSAALELADVRLPRLVFRLSSGEDAGTDDEVPFPDSSGDEIGQVRQAFNSVQRTAIEAAVGQARLRAGIAVIFRNLARRSQTLLHRQLAMLDDLELRATQPEELESLFQIDHLTTRMRRHAEGLVVLAGDRPGRGWKKPVPLADVLRGAVAEVEDYRRVRVITRSRAALAGRAVADVIHLIAELVENATLFSPPNTPVRVIGDLVGRGFAVEIEDRGLGVTEAAMAELNAKLADPPQVDLAATEQLGLYVAAWLAREHGIRVTLRDSPFGGTAAVVLIPNDLVVSEETYAADSGTDSTDELASQTSGRHAARSAVWDLPVLGGDAPAGSPGLAGASFAKTDAAPPATTPARTGAAEPFILAAPEAGEYPLDARGYLSYGEAARNGGDPVTQETADPGKVQHDPGEPAHPATVDLTEFGLPRRIRQTSLAPELREPQPPGEDGGVAGWRSPDETREAFTALQRGWERGRAGPAAASGTAAAASPDTGAGGGGGPRPPDTPEQEDTP